MYIAIRSINVEHQHKKPLKSIHNIINVKHFCVGTLFYLFYILRKEYKKQLQIFQFVHLSTFICVWWAAVDRS